MGFETGVILNIFGSLTINFSANLLKRAHLETAEELAQGVDDKLEGMDNMSNLDQQIKACDDKLDNAGSENGGTVNGPAEKVIGADTIENDELNKHIVKLENDHEVAPHRCKFPNRTWLAGVVLFIVGNVVNFVSFSFAAQSLLSALGSIQFVSNVVFARVLLHEVATKRMLFGTLLIILGNIVVVIYSSHESSGGFTVDELKDMYTASGYVGYISTLAVILVTAQAYYMYLMNKLEEEENGGPKLSLFSLQMIPTTYALVSGCIGTQSVTLAKSMSEVMRTSTEGDNQFSNYFTWVIFCSWVVCMVFWVTRMNIALRRFDGLFIVPVLQVVWTTFSILGGGIYFGEFSTFSELQFTMFFMGLLILFIGVAFLSPVATEEDDMSSELDEFDSIAGGSIGTSGGADNDDVVVDLEQQPYQGGRSRAHSRSRSSLRTFSLVLPTNAEGMRHEVRSSFVSRSGTGTTAGAAGNARNQNDTVSRSHTSRVSRSGTLSMARSPRSKGASQLVHRVERGFSLSMPMVSGHVLDHKRLAAHKASFRGMSSTSRSAKPMQHTQSMTVGRTNRLSNKMNVGDLLPKDSSRSDDEVDEKKNSLTSSNDTATNEHERKKMKAKHRTYSMY